MARHMFVYDDKAYEGELNLYRATHVGASHAEAVDSVVWPCSRSSCSAQRTSTRTF